MNDVKCPHCGKEFQYSQLTVKSLVPTHDWPPPCRSVCPGSGQIPRGIADKRILWKDEPAIENA
jgi:hypothetical protein